MNAFPARCGSWLLVLWLTAALLPAAGVSAEDKTAVSPAPGEASAEGARMVEPGGTAPDFTVRDLAGGTFHFAEENARKTVLLVFWSVFCEPCRLEMPVLQRLHDRHKDAGLEVVAVDLDGEPLKNVVAGFLRQEGYTFRVLIDELDAREMFRVADPYGVAWTPTFFLVEKGGKVALGKTGRVREDELEKAVQSLLKR
jgi:thiol-disulfide isomerase/thioredoxin